MNDDDKAKIIMGVMPLFIILAMMMSSINARANDNEAALANIVNGDYYAVVQEEQSADAELY